jgi:HEAT repeat protein
MAMERQSKVALIGLGIVVLLASLWWGYRQWQHHKLAIALNDPDPVVRMAAVRSAAKADRADLLFAALKDDDPDIRFVAVQSLHGGDNAKMVRALLEVLRDDRPWIGREALTRLRHMSPAARLFVYQALEDQDPRIRVGAALALLVERNPMMGRTPRPPGERETIIPLLTKLLDDEDREVRDAAALVLKELDWERGR